MRHRHSPRVGVRNRGDEGVGRRAGFLAERVPPLRPWVTSLVAHLAASVLTRPVRSGEQGIPTNRRFQPVPAHLLRSSYEPGHCAPGSGRVDRTGEPHRRTVLLLVAMVVLIVVIDVVFLRNSFGPRLAVNVGIVAVAAVVYLAFLRN